MEKKNLTSKSQLNVTRFVLCSPGLLKHSHSGRSGSAHWLLCGTAGSEAQEGVIPKTFPQSRGLEWQGKQCERCEAGA